MGREGEAAVLVKLVVLGVVVEVAVRSERESGKEGKR